MAVLPTHARLAAAYGLVVADVATRPEDLAAIEAPAVWQKPQAGLVSALSEAC
jgi:hypothetical protein